MKKSIKSQDITGGLDRRDLLLLGASGLIVESASAAIPVLTGLSVSGPGTLTGGDSGSFSAVAKYSDGRTKTVTASWVMTGTGASFSGTTLKTSVTESVVTVSLSATYKELNISKTAYATVFITPKQVSIKKVDGWGAGDSVVNGRWSGQAASCAKSSHRTDDYNGFLALESQSERAFTIYGENYGVVTPSALVRFLDSNMNPLSGVTVIIKKWADTRIDIGVRALPSFTFAKVGYVRVTLDKKPPPTSGYRSAEFSVLGFAGTISTRGYGQCTWHVSNRRAVQNLSVPADGGSIYGSGRTAIDASYIPMASDVLVYGTSHVAFIEGVSKPVYQGSGANKTTTWTLQVSEMNAACNESLTSDTRTFQIKGSGSTASIVTGIGTRASSSWNATHYYR